MKSYHVQLFFLLMLYLQTARGFSQEGECRIENGKIIFRIDLGWDAKLRNDFAIRYELDSAVMTNVLKENNHFMADSLQWTLHKLNGNIVELSRDFEEPVLQSLNDLDWFSFSKNFPVPNAPPPPPIGINNFFHNSACSYQNGQVTFFLKGNKNARNVFLSGTFNGWSTMQTPLTACDSGWITHLNLPPGKYAYKYIVNGRWTEDPENRLREKNEEGSYNSIIYCPNHVFRLQGYKDARKVFLAGGFNNWSPRSTAMLRSDDGWELPVFLREGTHLYKFIVDGEWITDPANPDVRPDANGNLNSMIGIGDSHLFRLSGYPNAHQVIVAGSFNNWKDNELLMNKTSEGWELSYILPAGMHEYKFIVDGKWMPDPNDPYTTGKGDFINSILAFKPNYTFSLKNHLDAKEVIVTGTFNGWNRSGYHMARNKDGWIFPIHLVPGKYTYKFIVDGNWILDPANSLWENNEYGTNNSVLWVNP